MVKKDGRKPVGRLPFVEVLPESLGNDVIEIRSLTNPKVIYRVDTVGGRCSCPAWKFMRGGVRRPCKHLISMGLSALKQTKGVA